MFEAYSHIIFFFVASVVLLCFAFYGALSAQWAVAARRPFAAFGYSLFDGPGLFLVAAGTTWLLVGFDAVNYASPGEVLFGTLLGTAVNFLFAVKNA